MWLDHLLIAIAWVIYCLLHSVLAGNAFKRKARQVMKTNYKFYRPAYTLFSFLGLIALLYWLVVLKSPRVFQFHYFVFTAGLIVALAGFVLMAICIRKYFLSLSGLKTLVNESNSQELIITGINRYLRHPLYLGTFVFTWGLWLLLPTISLLLTNIIIMVYTLIGIRFEEKKLVAEFGDSYLRYQQTVPKLWPRVPKKQFHIQ